MATACVPRENLCICWDNHSAHRAYYVRDFLAFKGVRVIFLPVYTSQFNPAEHCWSSIKRKWANYMSSYVGVYNLDDVVIDLRRISLAAGRTFTARMLTSNQKDLDKCMRGELV